MNMNLSPEKIKKNYELLSSFMKENDLDVFYISSFDNFLNEYVPTEECHRYYYTGFTGSMAELLVVASHFDSAGVKLFVDGRYHEQADKEVDSSYCHVQKCPFHPDIAVYMENLLKELQEIKGGALNIGIERERTSLGLYESHFLNHNVSAFESHRIGEFVGYKAYPIDQAGSLLDEGLGLSSFEQKRERVLKKDQALFINAIDGLSWLLNIRAYQLPNQSSLAAKAFVTNEKVTLFVDDMSYVDESILSKYEVILSAKASMETFFKSQENVKEVLFDPNQTSFGDFEILKDFFGDKLHKQVNLLTRFSSIKEEAELKLIKEAFESGDTAIFNALNEIYSLYEANEKVSEKQAYDIVGRSYENEGSKAQSFKTISAAGPNGSIMHYSVPSSEAFLTKGELYLLDSGGYFRAGFATDTTRTILLGESATAKQKEIYTLVLKGLLQVQNAIFPQGTLGSQIDALARSAMWAKGYDYAHGTGHGVGVNVHEGCFRLSPTSLIPLKANQVGSIEPGIYIPGYGGVRLENIAIVKKHPEFEGMLCFENLVWIGFDHKLIDRSIMTEQELIWLDEYENECLRRKRSFV
ncbi:M24 family metallopeptidase [Halobacteriovorax sp. GB3]|uniref:M24 family metallopeptidase n=1 Tax=Halobacteriovorax sp. GB3 TaxID=2719615 RepID=UPI00235F77EC|nr:M24 family metallopeptidase [Halobacteriovorax sp. GB3]MDD0852320.1 M24 family metallopeptidase [Halobacteriovorax sp. GB3]